MINHIHYDTQNLEFIWFQLSHLYTYYPTLSLPSPLTPSLSFSPKGMTTGTSHWSEVSAGSEESVRTPWLGTPSQVRMVHHKAIGDQ